MDMLLHDQDLRSPRVNQSLPGNFVLVVRRGGRRNKPGRTIRFGPFAHLTEVADYLAELKAGRHNWCPSVASSHVFYVCPSPSYSTSHPYEIVSHYVSYPWRLTVGG